MKRPAQIYANNFRFRAGRFQDFFVYRAPSAAWLPYSGCSLGARLVVICATVTDRPGRKWISAGSARGSRCLRWPCKSGSAQRTRPGTSIISLGILLDISHRLAGPTTKSRPTAFAADPRNSPPGFPAQKTPDRDHCAIGLGLLASANFIAAGSMPLPIPTGAGHIHLEATFARSAPAVPQHVRPPPRAPPLIGISA